MKVSFLERLLLAATGILGALLSAALGVVAYLGDRLRLSAGSYVITLRSGLWPSLIMGAVAVAALIWSIKLLALAFKHAPRQDRSSVSVQNTEDGSVRVSVAAMDTLVKQAIAQDEGVVDIKTSIVNHEDSISVNIDMTLASDVHIPNVTMMMQRNIKNFIEEFSGIAVREVTIMVSKIIEVTPQPPLALPEKSARVQGISVADDSAPASQDDSQALGTRGEYAPEEEMKSDFEADDASQTEKEALEPEADAPIFEAEDVAAVEPDHPSDGTESAEGDAESAAEEETVNEKDVW